jgi:Flp pilus assembly protein TadG
MTKDATGRGRGRAQAGQSLTELPIALVLFLVLAFGIVDAGRLIYAYNAVSLSAREGVRWAAVRGGASGHAASTADIRDFVQSKTVGVPVTVDVSWLPAGNNQPGSTVLVTVTNAFAPIAPLPLVPKTINLTSKSRMVISR